MLRMKHLHLLIVLCFSMIHSKEIFSQAIHDSIITKEIGEQVWYPFIKTFTAFDAEGFNALHTRDVLRAGPWGIRTGENYFSNNVLDNTRNKEAGNVRHIAFTFEHRVHTADTGYEVGYYRLKSIRDDITRTFYGQFHVVLKKTDGTWKIAQDWDANAISGAPVSEIHFVQYAEKGLYE